MRVLCLLLPAVAVRAIGNSFFKNSTGFSNGFTPYHLHAGMGVDVAADPPVQRPPPPLPNRPAEPASDEVWNQCRNKGCTLTWAMAANDAEVGPAYEPKRADARSPYRSFADLEKWGWNPYPPEDIDETFHDFYATWGIGKALAALGVSDYSDMYEGGLNRIVCVGHRSYDPAAGISDNQWYEANGKRYRATGAQYSMAINPKQGVIMGLSRLSPNYAATDREPPVPKELLPALNQFSDVAWIGWDALTKEEAVDVKELRYFLSVGIVNPFTKSVIRRAMDGKGWQLSPWPGHTFERQWFETRAILGTPNVQGFAYMLIQHKDILGNMYIDKVQVFRADNASRNPCIVIHLAKPRAQDGNPRRRGVGAKEVEVVKVVEVQPLRAKL